MSGYRRFVAIAVVAGLSVGVLSTVATGQSSGGGTASELRVELSSSASAVVNGPFDVTARFSEAVTGFAAGDIKVVNGTAGGFSGSGAVYVATVTPAADGSVVVRIPGGIARGAGGAANAASSILVRTAELGSGASNPSGGPWIDTWDRAVVMSAYRQEFERTEPDAGFTGDLAGCVAGTTSQAFRDSELQRVNWYRRMSGLSTVTENAEYTIDAQHAALMMGAQGALSHYPDASWACYSVHGAHGAAKSNLNLGGNGVESIDNYMTSFGHRQWVLSPFVEQIGMGDMFGRHTSGDRAGWSADANALFVVGALGDGRDSVREARRFVAWPPPGYLPAAVVPRSWTFSLFEDADVSAASVTVTSDAGAIPVEGIEESPNFRSSTLVWRVGGTGESVHIPEPTDGDACYTVTIRDVRIGGVAQAPYEYATCLLDLTEVSTVSGAPVAPRGLGVTGVTHDSITLSWTLDPQPAGVTVMAYVVEQFDGTGWIQWHRSSAAFSSFTASRLEELTEYRFRVRLLTTAGDTSATVTATTGAAPADTSSADIEMRVAARLLSSGRVEFALQQQLSDGRWSQRLLPAWRFFPTGAHVDHWLVSTPVAVTVEATSATAEVRIAARKLADGRIEFGMQGRQADGGWGHRALPSRRFFPTTSPVGRWLVSGPVTLTVRSSETTDPVVVVSGRPQVSATGGVSEFSASWWVDGDESPPTYWRVSTGSFSADFPAATTDYRWTNQQAGRYTIRVWACNEAGCGFPGSATVTVTENAPVAPGRPEMLAWGGVNEFSASWGADDAGAPPTSWRVSAGSFSADFPASTTYHRWANQDPGRYTVRVWACNEAGCGPEQSITVTVTDPVVAPGRPEVSATGGVGEFSVSWAADAAGAPPTYWRVSTGSFSADFPAATTDYRWANQDPGRYTVRVWACNEAGCGPYGSGTVTVTDPVVAPGRPQVSATGGVNEFSASWAADAAGSPPTYWRVSVRDFSADFPASTTYYRWANHGAGRYTVRVRACNEAGCGPEDSVTVTVTEKAPVAPGRPEVSASGRVGEFSASWAADSTGSPPTYWRVSAGSFSADFPASATSRLWANQDAGRYTVRVWACNEAGCGPYGSATVTVTAPAVRLPGRPHVTATGGVNEVRVSWRADDSGAPITRWSVSGGRFAGRFRTDTTSYRWTGLAAGEYTIRVRACNDAGCGPEATTTATVVEEVPPPAKRVILSIGDYAGAGSPRQLAGCNSQHCYFMRVDLEGFDPSGSYDVQCHHRGIPGAPAGTWSGTFSNSTWPMLYQCSFGYPGHTVYVRVLDPATGRFIDSNDIVWPSYGG